MVNSKIIASYGHGTENDFVIVYDPNQKLELNPEQISKICNRKTGLGADGLIRVVDENFPRLEGNNPKWFMDYRNQDGSLAEMCGNGIRVMARFLVKNKLQPAGIFSINTRAGRKFLSVPEYDEISVNMGKVELVDEGVEVESNGHLFSNGLNISVGNPHAVVQVDDMEMIKDLTQAPKVSPAYQFPDGVNVEFIEFVGEQEVKMRVHERGVGETKSCGTGVCAVGLAATIFSGKNLPVTWLVNPPGGKLKVEIDRDSNAVLTGPAVLIKEIDLVEFM